MEIFRMKLDETKVLKEISLEISLKYSEIYPKFFLFWWSSDGLTLQLDI